MRNICQKIVILSFILLNIVACDKDDNLSVEGYTNIQAGNVSGLWSFDESPFLIHGDITIPQGSLLTIEAGVIVKFAGHYKFNVQGRLLANGEQNKIISFTIRDTSGFSLITKPQGGWHGFRFNITDESIESSVISYSVIEYGKAIGESFDKYGGAIFINGYTKLKLENSILTNNYAEEDGGAIYIDTDWKTELAPIPPIIISQNVINENKCYNDGGAIYLNQNSGSDSFLPIHILNNEININNCYRYGSAIYSNYASTNISGNFIMNNKNGGGVLFMNSNPSVFTNNVVSNNQGGGVIYIEYNNEMINANNTIVNNTGRSGIHISSDYCENVILYNTIIWGNTDNNGQYNQLEVRYTDIETYNCIIGDGVFLNGTHSEIEYLNQDPLFANSSEYPFNISLYSPCINAGIEDTTILNIPTKDIAGNPRISGGRIDIGAYEFVY